MKTSSARTAAAIGLTVLLVQFATSACGSGGGGEGKGGGDVEPVTLVVETSQDAQNPGSQPLAEFERVAEKASGGSIEAEMSYEPYGGDDYPVIDDLRAGEAGVAAVPARALSRDVPALAALQAPFVLDSESDLNAVAQDAELLSLVSDALEEVGLVGIAVYPDGVRHFFSLDGRPIHGPADLRGRTVRGPESEDTAALMDVLGAALVSPTNEELVAGVAAGSIDAAESSYVGAATELPGDRVATGDVVLYGKFMIVAANKDVYDDLSDAQRDAVTEAATAATDWSLANHATEEDWAATYCDAGGRIVKAGVAAQAAFAEAAAPYLGRLADDPATAAIVDRMSELVEPGAVLGSPTCATADTTSATIDADAIVAEGGDLPDGTYRFELTPEYLSNYPDGDPANAGVLTFVLRDGRWSGGPDEGIYQVDGHELLWKYAGEGPPFGRAAKLAWTLDGDGSIRWTQLAPAFQDYIFGLPWTKID